MAACTNNSEAVAMKKQDKKLRVAIIGCGVVAPTHAEGFRAQDGVELALACDLVENKARSLAERYGFAGFTTDYRQVMADKQVDCVAVCTDHAAHVPITVAALKSGKHVLCEKALAADAKGLRRMFAAHARHPKLVFSGVFQHRFDPVNRCLKKMVRDGAFGRILTAGMQVRCVRTNEYFKADKWRGSWARSGGAVLINQAIHSVDIMAWIMGGVKSVGGAYANLTHRGVMETEDTATAAVCFRSGALGTIEATCSSNLGWEITISIHGTSGSVDVRDGQPIKMLFEDAAKCGEIEQAVLATRGMITAQGAKDYYGVGHMTQIADFVAAIRKKRRPFVPALAARHAVDIVLAIYRSHRDNGRRVELPTVKVDR